MDEPRVRWTDASDRASSPGGYAQRHRVEHRGARRAARRRERQQPARGIVTEAAGMLTDAAETTETDPFPIWTGTARLPSAEHALR